MINSKLPAIMYGGDYNPDQWSEEIWKEDMRLFKLAGINIVTLPVFSWAKLQPSEETYCFDWLDKVLDMINENGIHVCLATSTAAQPAWMSKKYPEILPVDVDGRKHTHGLRVNFCPNSKAYRSFSTKLAGKLAKRYKDHPALAIWHIGNEYGTHCYCEKCAEEFREWLKRKYVTVEELNKVWNMNFWGHTIYDWDEVVVPSNLNGDNRCFQGMSIDYNRFMSESILECYKGEYNEIKKVTPNIPITTNIWGLFNGLDLYEWAKYMDVVSWDSYPTMNEPISNVAMKHDFMRGLKDGKAFMLMEQTPSQQNWQPYNSLKRPGVMRLWSYQAIAHGSDSVMFFQLRRSFGSCEKYHGALIAHVGHENTRVFRECKQLGKELKMLGDTLLDSRIEAKVALLFDIDTWKAVELTSGPSIDLNYLAQAQKYYKAIYDNNINIDVINPSADISKYDIVIAPVFYMIKNGVEKNIEKFVENGGTFVTTFFSGIIDKNDLVTLGGYPGKLRKLLGIWVEEIDALLPNMKNSIIIKEPLGNIYGEYECGLLCDILHLEGARAIGVYGKDFYAGLPNVTVNSFGNGKAYYIASDPNENFIRLFAEYICNESGIKGPLNVPKGVEVTQRLKNHREFTFILNHNDCDVNIDLKKNKYVDLLTNDVKQNELILKPKDVVILDKR